MSQCMTCGSSRSMSRYVPTGVGSSLLGAASITPRQASSATCGTITVEESGNGNGNGNGGGNGDGEGGSNLALLAGGGLLLLLGLTYLV